MKYRSLCENHLFLKAYRGGRKAGRSTLVVYRLADKKAGLLRRQNPLKEKYNRVGVTVSKKLGNAVFRSRAKRLLREALRQIERERPMRQGNLLVLAARPGIAGKKMGDVRREMEKCFRDLDLFLPETKAPEP